MAVLDESVKPKFHQVRSIYGFGRDRADAQERYNHIPDGGMNAVIKQWQDKQPDRELEFASPSAMTRCPRSIWLELHGVKPTQETTWALKQRLLLGRLFENQFAEELEDAGMLLKHWKDYDEGLSPHIDYKSSEYTAWINMKMRCYNENDRCYEIYGARGITVCEKWRNNYKAFITDMGNKPSKNYSLDRIDNDGNYTPENCRWADKTTQARNQGAGKNSTTGIKGVYWSKAKEKYKAHIKVKGVDYHLGTFTQLEDAKLARETAEATMWKDDPGTVVEKFRYGNPGDPTYFEGVPDYLTRLEDGKVYISDAKTSRGDSFGYLPINEFELFTDGGWYKNRMQLTGYYILCHANADKMKAMGLPLPEGCHLFSYALDDGVVRREARWIPSQNDIDKFLEYTRRFNAALKATEAPACTCGETPDGFEIKFCKYGVKATPDAKICSSCCDDNLIPVKEV